MVGIDDNDCFHLLKLDSTYFILGNSYADGSTLVPGSNKWYLLWGAQLEKELL